MTEEPIYIRWENRTPPHGKFYEVEVELTLFYPKVLVRRWGRIGTPRPRTLRQLMPDTEALRRQVALVSRLRARHGYQVVAQMKVPVVQEVAA